MDLSKLKTTGVIPFDHNLKINALLKPLFDLNATGLIQAASMLLAEIATRAEASANPVHGGSIIQRIANMAILSYKDQKLLDDYMADYMSRAETDQGIGWYEFECVEQDGRCVKIFYGQTDDPATAVKVWKRLIASPGTGAWIMAKMSSPPTDVQLQWENQDNVGDLDVWLENDMAEEG